MRERFTFLSWRMQTFSTNFPKKSDRGLPFSFFSYFSFVFLLEGWIFKSYELAIIDTKYPLNQFINIDEHVFIIAIDVAKTAFDAAHFFKTDALIEMLRVDVGQNDSIELH